MPPFQGNIVLLSTYIFWFQKLSECTILDIYNYKVQCALLKFKANCPEYSKYLEKNPSNNGLPWWVKPPQFTLVSIQEWSLKSSSIISFQTMLRMEIFFFLELLINTNKWVHEKITFTFKPTIKHYPKEQKEMQFTSRHHRTSRTTCKWLEKPIISTCIMR